MEYNKQPWVEEWRPYSSLCPFLSSTVTASSWGTGPDMASKTKTGRRTLGSEARAPSGRPNSCFRRHGESGAAVLSFSGPHIISQSSGALSFSLSLSLTPLFCSAVTVTQPMPISLSYRQWDFRECLCHDIFCWWSQGTGDGEWPEEAKGIREVMSTSASWSSQAGSAPADLEECPPISELSTHL